MTNDQWRRVAFGLALVLVVTIAFMVAKVVAPGSPPPSTVPSPTPTRIEPTATPRGSPSVGPSSAPSVAPSVAPSPSTSPSSPSPSAAGPAPATVTIRRLMLDAQDDPDGRDRRLTFTTHDPAKVVAHVESLAPRGTVDACLLLNAVELFCTSGRTFTLNGSTSRSSAAWTLTLRGHGVATPTLDVSLEFPSAEPAVTIDGAWFDGAARPDHNGVVVELVPRAGPLVSIGATWEGSHDYRLTIQPPSGTGLVFEGNANAVARDVQLAVGELHRIELLNTGAGADRIAFTATIAWR